jgi:hypothetical protein
MTAIGDSARGQRSTTSDVDLDALERLAEAATPGPWCTLSGSISHVDGRVDGVHAGSVGEMVIGCGRSYCKKPRGDDATFIAAARDAVPALIAEVRSLRASLAIPVGVVDVNADPDPEIDAITIDVNKAEEAGDVDRLHAAAHRALNRSDFWHREFLSAAKYVEENARLHARVRELERTNAEQIQEMLRASNAYHAGLMTSDAAQRHVAEAKLAAVCAGYEPTLHLADVIRDLEKRARDD